MRFGFVMVALRTGAAGINRAEQKSGTRVVLAGFLLINFFGQDAMALVAVFQKAFDLLVGLQPHPVHTHIIAHLSTFPVLATGPASLPPESAINEFGINFNIFFRLGFDPETILLIRGQRPRRCNRSARRPSNPPPGRFGPIRIAGSKLV